MYTADFETIVDSKETRVWAWGICNIDTLDFIHGNLIETFIDHILKQGSQTYYFHNLKFDGQFLISYLLTHDWKHSVSRKLEKQEFSTIISDKNQFYQITLAWKNKKGKIFHIKLRDSFKLLPFSVAKIAENFKLPLGKCKIDYEKYREIGHILTNEEIEYLRGDVEIMARALQIFFSRGLTQMTIGSNALRFYSNLITQKEFDRAFPKQKFDKDIRQSYKGGWTYLKEGYSDAEFDDGIVLDVNSLYPYVLHDKPIPFGEGIYFNGKYVYDKFYPLYVCMIRVNFELKEGFLPTIQLKGNLSFKPTEYVKTSNDEEITICLTCVDLELFLEHYEIYSIEYLSGWKFRASTKMFREYVDYWMKLKIDDEKNGNESGRTIDKLYLNNLYGKFGKNPLQSSKIPYLDENGIVKYKTTKPENNGGIYIPVATFVTAHARFKTISTAQSVYDRFIYADTDSLHLIGTELPNGIEIDQFKLGAWKHENTFKRARFIRAKCYIEEIINKDGTTKLNVKCSGLPKDAIVDVTFDNFHPGFITGKSLKQKVIKGGAYLAPTTFEIKA